MDDKKIKNNNLNNNGTIKNIEPKSNNDLKQTQKLENSLKNQHQNISSNPNIKNLSANKEDSTSQRLQQALNKGKNGLQQAQEVKEQTTGEKIDKIGEEAVKKFGGKAITAATGGVVSGPVADAIAKTVAKPVGKTLKYGLLITFLPLFFIVFFCFSIFIAISTDETTSNATETTNTEGSACTYKTKEGNFSKVKIQLKKCSINESGNKDDNLENGLIDLEDYVMGVVNQEIGGGRDVEAIKAQAIATRTYTISKLNTKSRFRKKDDYWVINLYACTDDQAYCDPYNGCHSKCNLPKIDDSCGAAGMGGTCHSTIYSGNTSGAVLEKCNNGYWNKGPASQKVIDAVKATSGQVAVTADGKVPEEINYGSKETNTFSSLAENGLDAYEIIKKVYSDKITSVTSDCVETESSTPGDFANWKQCNRSWSNIKIATSGKNICDIGCAATSVSIQIANSGTEISIPKLDPGTFVETLNANGGFVSGGSIIWEKASVVAPKFTVVAKETISGDKQNKADKLQQYINNGEYVVIGVHQSASDSITHWVALNKVSGEDVYIFDPGSSSTKLFERYPYTKSRNISIRRYKVK